MSNKDLELHKKAFELYTQGLTLEEIGSQLGVSPNTLRYWKSTHCKCSCSMHGWVPFKKKLAVQVPATIVESVRSALQPKLTAHQMITVLETICADSLQNTKGQLRPQTWRELLETFKLIVELKKVYGPGDEEFEISETRKISGKRMDMQQLIDGFMAKVEAEQVRGADVVGELIKQSLEES
jgi:hypothetical protein